MLADPRRGWLLSMAVVVIGFLVVLLGGDSVLRPLGGALFVGGGIAQAVYWTIAWRRTGPHDAKDFWDYGWLLRDHRSRRP